MFGPILLIITGQLIVFFYILIKFIQEKRLRDYYLQSEVLEEALLKFNPLTILFFLIDWYQEREKIFYGGLNDIERRFKSVLVKAPSVEEFISLLYIFSILLEEYETEEKEDE